ncbi:lytic transglycosylase domain-containing protein [Lutibaculum baratangense]|uniref:Transglycosylase n=1 Tax=Lutibaculum baratangense AMV1 TaxID=631454 RepID=V4RIP1_9HYPH|nr:lytic transglycosylase domain-containing protein [Lutibaculum baratangense]ESR23145.1 transglycosylase [Lutibaculum baratangense AMV1]
MSTRMAVATVVLTLMAVVPGQTQEDAAPGDAPAEVRLSPHPPTAPDGDAEAGEVDRPEPQSRETLCDLVEAAAEQHDLPIGFFARLIQTESSFNPRAVSPKGAEGIAQFMRGTADLRGLVDPFDPATAITASAHYLSDLRDRFGNLGLAAAAYNAGENRVLGFVAGDRGLPLETRNYVWKITGRGPEDWLPQAQAEDAEEEQQEQEQAVLDPADDCLKIASGRGQLTAEKATGTSRTTPWGVQLAGNHSLDVAMAGYRRQQQRHASILGDVEPMVVTGRVPGRGPRRFYQVQAPAESRDEAERICGRLRANGGNCLVQRNR